MNIYLYLFFILLAVCAVIFFEKFSSSKESEEKPLPYKKKDYLLTVAEKKFYDVLIKIAEENNWVVFSKVRLEDLLWLPKGVENRFGLRNRIKSRHIDFVLCDKENIRPLLAIELDDSSHEREDRVERDKNINQILKGAELPVLHIETMNTYNSNNLLKQIEIAVKK